jgi:adenylate cyclase
MDKKNRFFLLRILDVLTKRIKSKVIFFEIFIILFVALSVGLSITIYIEKVLVQKAHKFSERIAKDLAKSVEYNYISLPAADEAVKSFAGTEGILYLGYDGYIISKKATKVHLFIGENIGNKALARLSPVFKELNGFAMDHVASEYGKNSWTVLLRYSESLWNRLQLLWTPKEDVKKREALKDKIINYFEYYMPVSVQAGSLSKKIGNVVLRYSFSIIRKEIENIRFLIAIITGIIVVIGIYISVRGANSIVKPIAQLTRVVRRFGEGDLSARANLPVKDEIGVLGRTFDEMIVSVQEKLEMQKFVSDSTVKMIKKSVGVNPMGEKREKHTERKVVTLFFSDIRGFTSMSEKLDPQKVVNILNEYLDVQSNIIKSFGGDIDKFVGDEIVAVFEDESMCQSAVSAAREAQKKIKELNDSRKTQGLFPVEIGIGINSGEVVMGSIGSHDRMDFTVIGDNVNLAARLCSAAGKGEIIIAKSVYDGLGNDRKGMMPLEPIFVKGKTKPIEVFRVEY